MRWCSAGEAVPRNEAAAGAPESSPIGKARSEGRNKRHAPCWCRSAGTRSPRSWTGWFLYGLCKNLPGKESGKIGNIINWLSNSNGQCFICCFCTIRDLPVGFGCQRAWLRRDQFWSTAEAMEKSLEVAGPHSWRLHPTIRKTCFKKNLFLYTFVIYYVDIIRK